MREAERVCPRCASPRPDEEWHPAYWICRTCLETASKEPPPPLTAEARTHLADSGLDAHAIQVLKIRMARPHELPQQHARAGRSGILFPYLDFQGRLQPFYRIRLLHPLDPSRKYHQPAGSANHLYLPHHDLHPVPRPDLQPDVWQQRPDIALIITEGEKKAALAVRNGHPALAVTGWDSWRTLRLPISALESHSRTHIRLRADGPDPTSKVAVELTQILWRSRTVYLIPDSDARTNPQVQRAVFELASWLADRGARVLQVDLPDPVKLNSQKKKIGLDDYLLEADLAPLLKQANRFPHHPEPKAHIQRLLNGTSVLRREAYLDIARTALAALDRTGVRLVGEIGSVSEAWYFDRETYTLYPFPIGEDERVLRASAFGRLLYERFGILASEKTVLSRLSDLYRHEPPVQTVIPDRILRVEDDAVCFQLSDVRFLRVTKDDFTFHANGDNAFFLPLPEGAVPVDVDALTTALTTPIAGRWEQWLDTLQIHLFPGLNARQTRRLITVIFHLSPWLRRWRGLQLPFEWALGQPSSGKSLIYMLRRMILTGSTRLDNPPNDIRDWYAVLANLTAPLMVMDNVNQLPAYDAARLAGEIARIVTELDPVVATRELRTTAAVRTIPVRAALALTAITPPFAQPDLVQRAFIYRLAPPNGAMRSASELLDPATRPLWLAEHLRAVQELLRVAATDWRPDYPQRHRLGNLEQAALLMGRALGYADAAQLVEALASASDSEALTVNPIFDALLTLAAEWPSDPLGGMRPGNHPYELRVHQAAAWFRDDPEGRWQFAPPVLGIKVTSAESLGRFISEMEDQILRSTGIRVEHRHSRRKYLILPANTPPR